MISYEDALSDIKEIAAHTRRETLEEVEDLIAMQRHRYLPDGRWALGQILEQIKKLPREKA